MTKNGDKVIENFQVIHLREVGCILRLHMEISFSYSHNGKNTV